MKKTTLLMVILCINLLIFSCKKKDIEDTPYIKCLTFNILRDSVIYPEATYIKTTNSVKFLDTIADTTFFVAPTYSKLVFDQENNISLRYLGGYIDPDLECNTPEPTPFQPAKNSFIDTIYVYKDTTYSTRIIKSNYAIFERTYGDSIFIDTAHFVFMDNYLCMNIYSDLSEYMWLYNNVFLYNYDMYTKINSIISDIPKYLKDYYSIDVPEKKKQIYMMDIYPVRMIPVDSAQLVLFIN